MQLRPSGAMEKIYTINARVNSFLEVTAEHFNLTSPEIQKGIYNLFQELKSELAFHKIKYSSLKNALIPSKDKKEMLLVFDPTKIDSSVYGIVAMDAVLNSLGLKGKHSILAGDLIYWGNSQEYAFDMVRYNCNWNDSFPTTFFEPFFIYVNNLTNHKFEQLRLNLISESFCVGFSDLSFHSDFKEYISTFLTNSFVLLDNKVIVPNEDHKMTDNPTMYDLEEYGLNICSIQDILYGVFLSYKIECKVNEGFEEDFRFSMNAVSEDASNLGKMKVKIKDEKFDLYLQSARKKNLELLGVDELSKTELEEFLESKILSNYIYNLEINEHGIKKFVINIENNTKSKMVLVFEYLNEEGYANLLTAY